MFSNPRKKSRVQESDEKTPTVALVCDDVLTHMLGFLGLQEMCTVAPVSLRYKKLTSQAISQIEMFDTTEMHARAIEIVAQHSKHLRTLKWTRTPESKLDALRKMLKCNKKLDSCWMDRFDSSDLLVVAGNTQASVCIKFDRNSSEFFGSFLASPITEMQSRHDLYIRVAVLYYCCSPESLILVAKYMPNLFSLHLTAMTNRDCSVGLQMIGRLCPRLAAFGIRSVHNLCGLAELLNESKSVSVLGLYRYSSSRLVSLLKKIIVKGFDFPQIEAISFNGRQYGDEKLRREDLAAAFPKLKRLCLSEKCAQGIFSNLVCRSDSKMFMCSLRSVQLQCVYEHDNLRKFGY